MEEVLYNVTNSLRLQVDLDHMSHEDDRGHLLREYEKMFDEMRDRNIFMLEKSRKFEIECNTRMVSASEANALLQSRVAKLEHELEISNSKTIINTTAAGNDSSTDVIKELKEQNKQLSEKNGVLKHNFYVIEKKYKALRAEGNDMQEKVRSQEKLKRGVSLGGFARAATTSNGSGDKARYSPEAIKNENDRVSSSSGSKVKRANTVYGVSSSTSNLITSKANAAVTENDSSSSSKGNGRGLKRALTEGSTTRTDKHFEVVRKKSIRETLPGHDCDDCRNAYEALKKSGVIKDVSEFMKTCSRHKYKFTPPDTPVGFWSNNMSMNTPNDNQK